MSTHLSSKKQNQNSDPAETMTVSVKPVLMVVDDDDGVRLSLRVLFSSDYQVLLADSGMQALSVLQSNPVDVVILDLNMPGMTGIQLLEKLKRLDPSLEVIILTGQGSLETARQALSLGAFAYLTKPFELKEGRETVIHALDRRRQTLIWRALERELQERKTEQELARVKSEIYASVIHDLNSPLTATIGLLELLHYDVDAARHSGELDLKQVWQNVQDARTQIDFCAAIIQRYLRDMRRPDQQPVSADLAIVLGDLKRMIRVHPAAKTNQCVIHIPDEPILVRANGLDLLQGLINLTSNALQASENKLHVEVYCRHLPGDQTLRELQSTPNDTFLFGERLAEGAPMVSITVQDDGPGILPEMLNKVFDRYYSTKERGNGTGIGLSVVQRVLDENNGALHLHSVPGEGTAFTVFLPVA
jgi:signal transduction histidine kinase